MTDFISLFVIVVVALLAPFISHLVPRSYLPEVVVLVAGGMIVGPNVLGLIEVTDAITLLSELGLAFLFLLAGYEIDINEINGKKGAIARRVGADDGISVCRGLCGYRNVAAVL